MFSCDGKASRQQDLYTGNGMIHSFSLGLNSSYYVLVVCTLRQNCIPERHPYSRQKVKGKEVKRVGGEGSEGVGGRE